MKLSVTKQQIQFFFQNVTRSLGRPQGENVHRIQLTKTSGANRGDTLLMKTTYLIRSDKKARAKDPDQPAEVAADRPAETRTHAIRLNRKFQGVDGEERVLRAGEDSSGPGGDKESADGSAASSQPAMEAGGDRESADGSAASSQPAKEAGGDRESADGSEVGQDYGTKKRGAKPGGTLTSTGPDNGAHQNHQTLGSQSIENWQGNNHQLRSNKDDCEHAANHVSRENYAVRPSDAFGVIDSDAVDAADGDKPCIQWWQ